MLMKKSPKTSSETIATLTDNDKVIKIFEKDGWVKVGLAKNGDAGWITEKSYQEITDTNKKTEPKSDDHLIVSTTKDSKIANPQTRTIIKEGNDNGLKYKIIEQSTSYQTDNSKKIGEMMDRMREKQQKMIEHMNQSFSEFEKQMFSEPTLNNSQNKINL